MAACMAAAPGTDGCTHGLPLHHRATLPPGFRAFAAFPQNAGMSNQWAAVAAVMRSTVPSGTGGERLDPRSSAVEMSKRIGSVDEEPPRDRAVVIIPSDGSNPMACVKRGARARTTFPGPHPT